MTNGQLLFDRQYKIYAGKFRRYHGESWAARLLDVKTNLYNLRDFFLVGIGTLQSLWLLKHIKPDVILLKGGFVGVPVGLAAAAYKLPFVTHDSDALPGLANRLVSKWARYHATGMPAENYNYPKAKTRFVGVLVGDQYDKVTAADQKAFKRALDVPEDSLLLLVTGGSLGASSINKAMVRIVPSLLKSHPKLWVVHQVGRGKQNCYKGYNHKRLQIAELLDGLYVYTGAADLVVTRAGANTLAELGVQAKACIVVPNPLLTGGHQIHNAKHLQDEAAVVTVDDTSLATSNGKSLAAAIEKLLDDSQERHKLGQNLHHITPKDATTALAELLLKTGKRAGE